MTAGQAEAKKMQKRKRRLNIGEALPIIGRLSSRKGVDGLSGSNRRGKHVKEADSRCSKALFAPAWLLD